MRRQHRLSMLRLFAGAAFAAGVLGASLHADTLYVQTNLTSDINGMAAHTDSNLKNSWGMSFGPTTPFWVSDQVTNVSTLYNGSGTPLSLVVATPPGPTGQVFNITPSFDLSSGGKALFIFDTLSGMIAAWNMAQGTTATIQFAANDGSVFTGLAIGHNGSADLLYAANFSKNRIDVFGSNFAQTTLPGGFTDPNLPAGYAPYNIQAVAGKLYVEYDKVDPTTHRPTTTPNTGIVDVYNMDGSLSQRLATNNHLNSPWGITQAPAGFGSFGGDLLVGNFGDGTISAFDPTSGVFLGTLSDLAGHPIVNSGLWALNFRAPGSGFDPNALFFTAGINNEADGLFGEITAVPEPSTVGFLVLGICAGALLGLRARASRP